MRPAIGDGDAVMPGRAARPLEPGAPDARAPFDRICRERGRMAARVHGILMETA